MKAKNKNHIPWYKQKVVVICMVVAAACLITAGVLIVRQYKDRAALQEQTASLKEEIEMNVEAETSATENSVESEMVVSEVEEEKTTENTVEETQTSETKETVSLASYQELFDENADMCAWIKINDTVIDYPVMQTMRDENYYLKRDFSGNTNSNGCLIMDTDSDVETPGTNLIIHGHNMKSGEMFGGLTKYKEQSYYEGHKTITLTTRNGERLYEVMAVFSSQVYKKTDNCFKYYKFFQANNQSEFDDFYNNVMDLAEYDTGVTAEYGDHFLTLSTCAYHVDNGRFVVVAKQID